MLSEGTKAPDFEAALSDGSVFRLSEHAGQRNVVLYFYPKAFSGGCTRQACSFRDNYDVLKQYDAVIVGVSSDSAQEQAAFSDKNALNFPMIPDTDQRVSDLYDVKRILGVLRPRVTYVIDKQGVIRSAFRHDVAIGRHLSDTLDALEQIQAS